MKWIHILLIVIGGFVVYNIALLAWVSQYRGIKRTIYIIKFAPWFIPLIEAS